jgi:hypothetical protein
MKIDEEIRDEKEKIKNLREIRSKRSRRVEDLKEGLDEARDLVHRKRERVKRMRDEDKFEPDWTEEQRDRHLEAIADDIDEAESEVDRFVELIDEVSANEDEARRHLEHELGRLDRLRDKRKRMREDRAGRLSEHFHVAEFDCNNGTAVPKAAHEALKAWCREVGEPMRGRFGAVHVNSGYRTQSYNAGVGGESNSIHIYDLHPNAVAVDVHCDSGSAREWYDFTAGKADGRGLYATFHHADNRNRIGWGDATWSG